MDEEHRRHLNAITLLLSLIVGLLATILVVIADGTPIAVLVVLPLVLAAVAATLVARLA